MNPILVIVDLWILILSSSSFFATVQSRPLLDCDPCIARSDYIIKVISHGTKRDIFWQRVQAAAKQSALDMGVQLDFELYEEFDVHQMATDIENIADNPSLADALLVTVPSVEVKEAIKQALANNIPVFGFNSGYDTVEELGLYGFVGQEEYLAGVTAGYEVARLWKEKQQHPNDLNQQPQILLRNNKNKTIARKALFINHEKGNDSMEQRYQGFNHSLHNEIDNLQRVDELIISSTDINMIDENDMSMISRKISNIAFANGCPYDFILLAGATSAIPTVSAYVDSGCKEKGVDIIIGTFDESAFVIKSIVQENLHFATSQQKYIQSVLPIVMTSLYATTHKKLALPSGEYSSVYLSGPAVYNINNLPTDTLVQCENDAFPICPNQFAPDGITVSKCDCIDRNEIRIGGVLHGVTTDSFWDPVFESAEQAAKDMGVRLELERFQYIEDDTNEILHQKMAKRIQTLCESGVDGIFITIPSDVVVNAIRVCQLLNVPIISINAGAAVAKEMNLMHHIGQLEYDAGYGAGVEFTKQEGIDIALCFNHEISNIVTNDRCRGFEDAIEAFNNNNNNNNRHMYYGGNIDVGFDSKDRYIKIAEDTVNGNKFGIDIGDNWDNVGILLMGPSQLDAAVALKELHTDFVMGTFDISPKIHELVDKKELIFGVDQQPFLQGNLPVYLLTYMSYTKQRLLNNAVQTGPAFITVAPNADKQICESNNYKVCVIVPEEELNYIASYMLVVGYCFVAFTLLAGFIALFWVYYYKYKSIVRASQPPFLAMIIGGCMLSSLSILALGAQTSYRVIKDPSTGALTEMKNPHIMRADVACMAFPWLYGIGFVVTFSALFAKTYRVKLIYAAGQAMRRGKISMKVVTPILFKIVFVESLLLIIWQFVSPFKWEREILSKELIDGTYYAIESVGTCKSDNGLYFVLVILIFHILCLFYALVLCFQTKHIPTEFAESNWVSLAVICIFQISVLAIPIAILVHNDTTAFYFVLSCAIFLQNFTVLSLIFIPKMVRVISGDDELPLPTGSGHGSNRRNSSRGGTRTRISGLDFNTSGSGSFRNESRGPRESALVSVAE